jgi:lambda family phage portal protein
MGRALGRAAVKAIDLSERPTGRLDSTWSARNSSTTSAYEAGAVNRSNADWRTGLSSATLAIIESLDVMLARSRWQIRNDGYAASAQGAYRRRVVGGGITARAAARHPAAENGAMLTTYNRARDTLWNAWALDPLACDVEKTKCLYEKQAVWMDELFAAGGVLIRPVYTPRQDKIGLALQEIEYEQLDTSLTQYGNNAVYHGIETDAYGAPVAYHVFAAAHPLEEQASVSTRIPADGMWHLFRKTRARQRIGVPMMAAVMPALRSLAQYETFMVARARTEAAYHGFIEEPAASTATADQIRQRISGKPRAGEAAEDPGLQVRVENGLFPILRGDRKVKFPEPVNPNTMYPPFVEQNLKRIAAGTGLDLPTVLRWYADGNFNTQRRAQLEIEAEVEALQDLLFINGILRNVCNLFLEIAVREGKLQATGFFTSARWRAAYEQTNWQGPPQKSVDGIKDQATWDMKFRGLRGTLQDYCNEQGTTVEDVLTAWDEVFDQVETNHPRLLPILQGFFEGANATAPKAGMAPDGTGSDANPADAQPGAKQPAPLATRGGNGPGRLSSAAIIDALVRAAMREEPEPAAPGGNGHGGNGHGGRT